MADSVLLKLARDSMLEVYQARRIIDKASLLRAHPILATPMNCTVSIYLNDKKQNTYTTQNAFSLIDNIILAAKKAAFEDTTHSPLTTSQFLTCVVELTLYADEGEISEKDSPILKDDSTLIV